jgi:hypothetical protein
MFVHPSPPTLHACLLPYIKILSPLQHFEQTIFKRVILFHLEYFMRLFLCNSSYVSMEILQNFACLIISIWRFAYCYRNLIFKVVAEPFWLRILHQKVCTNNYPTFKWEPDYKVSFSNYEKCGEGHLFLC